MGMNLPVEPKMISNKGVWLFRGSQVVYLSHIRIARGMVIVGLFLIAGKFVGMLKDITIAHHYGVSKVMDAYLLAFNFVTWLPAILWSIGTVVLVPIFVVLSKGTVEERLFLKEVNGSTIQLGLLITAATVGTGSVLLPLLVKGWDAQAVDFAKRFTWQLAPVGLMLIFSASLSIRLQAREQYIFTFLEAMPALGVTFSLLLFPSDLGGAPLIWGTLAGAGVQLGLLIWIANCTHSLGDGIAWRHHSAWWKRVYANFGIIALGQMAISLAHLVDNVWAAQLGEGAVAILGYANRLVALLAGLAATTIGRALLPVLSQAAAARELRLGQAQALRWAGLIFLASGLMGLLLWLLSPIIVALLFQRGAFTASDTVAVARVLRFDLIQLPFYCSGIVLVQWFAATGRYFVLAGLSILGLIIKVALNAILVPILGVAGIALSTGGMYFVIMIILLILTIRAKYELG